MDIRSFFKAKPSSAGGAPPPRPAPSSSQPAPAPPATKAMTPPKKADSGKKTSGSPPKAKKRLLKAKSDDDDDEGNDGGEGTDVDDPIADSAVSATLGRSPKKHKADDDDDGKQQHAKPEPQSLPGKQISPQDFFASVPVNVAKKPSVVTAHAKKQTSSAFDEDAFFADDVDYFDDEPPVKKPAPAPAPTAVKRKNDDVAEHHSASSQAAAHPPQPSKQQKKSDGDEPLDPEVAEAQKQAKEEARKSSYKQFMQRTGPLNPGSKPIPVGAPNCLLGLTFVFSGDMDSTPRDQAEETVKRYGGRVTSSISSKTSYLVAGANAGESKSKKAAELRVKVIDEDTFLDLIRNKPAQKEPPIPTSPSKKKKSATASSTLSSATTKAPEPASDFRSQMLQRSANPPSTAAVSSGEDAPKSLSATSPFFASKPTEALPLSSSPSSNAASASSASPSAHTAPSLWTEKYRPKTRKEIIGNEGNVDKLIQFLTNWEKNRSGAAPVNKSDPIATNKAVLISGPPGIGKTTSALVAANEAGYEVIEFNASDTRSKKSLEQHVMDLVGNRSMSEFYNASGAVRNSKPIVLVMDEVDGMSSGDRGGVAELNKIIKKTKIPIICICNDPSSPKMKTLLNNCFDMRFRRTEALKVAGRLRAIAFKEKLQIDTQSLEILVNSTQCDIRQVLNLLSTYRLKNDSMNFDQAKSLSGSSSKNFTTNPFDVTTKLLSYESEKFSVEEKSDLYFHDFSLIPLMIEENYIKSATGGSPAEQLQRLSKAADSIVNGDLISRVINSNQDYSLLPAHAVMSSVTPSFYCHSLHGRVDFAGWLGKNSSQSKMARLLRELQIHTTLRVSASRNDFRESYIQPFTAALTKPLVAKGLEGIDDVLSTMEYYYLNREDLDSLIEVNGGFGGTKDPMANVPTQVKSSFTRKYTSSNFHLPYAQVKIAPIRGGGGAGGISIGGADEAEDEGPEEEEEDDDKDDDEDPTKDKMIKQKTSRKAAGAKGSAASSSSSSGSGSGTGKGKGSAN